MVILSSWDKFLSSFLFCIFHFPTKKSQSCHADNFDSINQKTNEKYFTKDIIQQTVGKVQKKSKGQGQGYNDAPERKKQKKKLYERNVDNDISHREYSIV